MFVTTGNRQLETLAAEHIGQGGQSTTHFLCAIGNKVACRTTFLPPN